MELQKSIEFFIRKGLSTTSLRSLTAVAKSQVKLASLYGGSLDQWDYHTIPAKLFSDEQTPFIRQRRIFAVLLLFNLNNLKDNLNFLNRFDNLTKRTHTEWVIEALSLWYSAYQLTVENTAFLEKGAALSFTASTNLIRSYNRGLVTFGECIYCGNPVLLEVNNVYAKNQYYNPNFFRCPWCDKKDKKLRSALEQQLYESTAWKNGLIHVEHTRSKKIYRRH